MGKAEECGKLHTIFTAFNAAHRGATDADSRAEVVEGQTATLAVFFDHLSDDLFGFLEVSHDLHFSRQGCRWLRGLEWVGLSGRVHRRKVPE